MPDSADTAPFPESAGWFDNSPAPFLPDDEDYRITLAVFEGPIDLLLYLIRKKELDIHEISLSEVVREYLDYVEIIKLIDIERAGDFIVVASTLMKIKSRSLFESQEAEEALQGADDPRESLIRYLMEYERLGGVAEVLSEKEDERRGVFPRGGEKTRLISESKKQETAPDSMLFDLLSAMKDVLKSTPSVPTHEVELLNVTSEMKQKEILERLGNGVSLEFIDFVRGQPRIIVVVTFVAMLELIKKREIKVGQSHQFGRILIEKRDPKEPLERDEDLDDTDPEDIGDDAVSESGDNERLTEEEELSDAETAPEDESGEDESSL